MAAITKSSSSLKLFGDGNGDAEVLVVATKGNAKEQHGACFRWRPAVTRSWARLGLVDFG